MVSENEYQMWLLKLGIDENVINFSTFYDKGYAFFRYCMNSGIDDDNIVELVKFMMRHEITDSRDINKEMWDLYMEETGRDESDVRDLLEESGDMIDIPELMNFLTRYNNIVLTGGGINECLKEVEIALMSLDKPYKILNKYTY